MKKTRQTRATEEKREADARRRVRKRQKRVVLVWLSLYNGSADDESGDNKLSSDENEKERQEKKQGPPSCSARG